MIAWMTGWDKSMLKVDFSWMATVSQGEKLFQTEGDFLVGNKQSLKLKRLHWQMYLLPLYPKDIQEIFPVDSYSSELERYIQHIYAYMGHIRDKTESKDLKSIIQISMKMSNRTVIQSLLCAGICFVHNVHWILRERRTITLIVMKNIQMSE